MIAILSKYYSYTLIGRQNKFKSILRFFIRKVVNFLLPINYGFWLMFSRFDLRKLSYDRNLKIICSLTTFPARVSNIWLTIVSLMHQYEKPDKIILWLSKDQFLSIDDLPKKLLKLRDRGLEIYLCDGDLRSHKKYYYAMKEFPNDIIITFDDDVYYDPRTLGELYQCYLKDNKSIWINRGWRIKYDINGEVLPYKKWEFLLKEQAPSYNILQTGVGGVLYPPYVMHSLLLNDLLFMEYCQLADDIWLYFMANINNTKIGKTGADFLVIPIFNKNDVKLSAINVGENRNDNQFKNVISFLQSENIAINS